MDVTPTDGPDLATGNSTGTEDLDTSALGGLMLDAMANAVATCAVVTLGATLPVALGSCSGTAGAFGSFSDGTGSLVILTPLCRLAG